MFCMCHYIGRISLCAVAVLSAATVMAQPRAGSKGDLAAAAFYAPDTVQTIRITIAPKDLARQKAALPEEIYVPGTFSWNGITLKNVAIRYKGNSSRQPNQPFKRSFLIKFSEYVKRQRFLGLERVALDNGIQFGGLYSEILILEILRDLGVPVSRANYARLYLNGAFMGIYVNVERIDKAFVKNHFDDGRGMLYKVNIGGPGADFSVAGDDPSVYARAFEAKTHRKTANFRDLAQLMRDINETPDDAIVAKLEKTFELDDFLWMTAVLLLSGAFDQYTGWQPHNYYLYHDPSDGKWSYIPWDLDVGFVTDAFGHINVLKDWNAAYPLPLVPRPLLERICKNEELLARYRERAKMVLETYFRPERLEKRLDMLYGLIKDDLAKDPFPPGRITVPSDRSHADVVPSMKEYVRLRYAKARKELDEGLVTEPMDMAALARQRQQRGPGGPGGRGPQPKPGEPSEQDPTGLALVDATSDRVVMRWENHAVGAAAHIVQKCVGETCDNFSNLMPVHSPATDFEDRTVTPGTTVRYRVYAVWPTPDGKIRGSGPSNVVTVKVPQ